MRDLTVDAAELRSAAARWHDLAQGLQVPSPPVPPDCWQPTAGAVADIHAAVDTATAALTQRIADTAKNTDVAAAHYTRTDEDGGNKIATTIT